MMIRRLVAARLRRVSACQDGSVVVEFAFLVPMFTFVLFSIIEFGFVFVAYGSMHFAAANTARQIGVNSLTAAAASAAVKSKMPAWVSNAATVTTTPIVNANPLKSSVRLTVSAPVRTATPLPYFTLAPSWILSTSVIVRQELPYDG